MKFNTCSKLYCYAMAPIDEFFRVLTLEEAVQRHRGDRGWTDLLEHLVRNAKIGWSNVGMLGPLSSGPFVFHIPVPGESDLSVGLIQKQVDNGMTFVATYVPLHEAPWFDTDPNYRCVVDCATGAVSKA